MRYFPLSSKLRFEQFGRKCTNILGNDNIICQRRMKPDKQNANNYFASNCRQLILNCNESKSFFICCFCRFGAGIRNSASLAHKLRHRKSAKRREFCNAHILSAKPDNSNSCFAFEFWVCTLMLQVQTISFITLDFTI